MAEALRCERCGGESPADARFCIDCGAPLVPAATGPTARLAGMRCPNCQTVNPENARFCVVCGHGLVAGTASRPRPTPVRPVPRQSYPRVDARPAPIPVRPAPPAWHGAAHGQYVGMLVFLVGLLLLIATHRIWPGILLLIGISSLIGQTNRGRPEKGLAHLIWWGGLALLFATGLFWPGLLLLILLCAAISNWAGPSGWRYW